MNMQADPTWPDSTAFWQDKRVIVTGGSGFLGSFVVDKLRARGAAKVIVPRRAYYDLCDSNGMIESPLTTGYALYGL